MIDLVNYYTLIFWIAIIHLDLRMHTFHCNTKALMACHMQGLLKTSQN